MADLKQIEAAFLKADAAGDKEAAAALAGEVRRLRAVAGGVPGGAPAPVAAPAAQPAPEPSLGARIGQQVGNLAAGAIRGAGSIGATLLYPLDKAQDMYYGDRGPKLSDLVTGNKPLSRNEERRQQMDAALSTLGAETDSLAYGVGKIGAEIAGTAGVGGAAANVLGRAPGVAAAAPELLTALRTAGMSGGTMGARAAGGAANGALSAALVNPSDAASGAVIGGLLPPGIALAGRAGRAVGNTFRGPAARTASELARSLDLQNPAQVADAIARLRAAPELVPGSVPDAAQALQTPQAGILQRVVSDSAGGVRLKEALAAQNAARIAALENVAPTSPTGYAAARQDLGEAVARYGQAERAMANEAVGGMYRAVDPTQSARVVLPADDMAAAAGRYTGAGSVGENSMPQSFVDEARRLSAPTQAPVNPLMIGSAGPQTAPRGSTWDEVMRMRASLNDEWLKAQNAGDRQAAAALDAQKRALDNAIEQQLPPGMMNQWREANASRAAMGQRFDTGPQAAIFQTRNGVPVVQGGEVAAKFWGNRPGVADDVRAFRRLVNDNPAMLGQLQSMITTEGLGTRTAAGNLGAGFPKWVERNLPGLEQAFGPEQVQMMQRIAEDVRRAEMAAAAGMSRGSNTYQNAQNALSLGLLDTPMLSTVANMVPGVNMVAGPALSWVREGARDAKARRLAALLSDSRATAQALEGLQPASPGVMGQLFGSEQLRQLGYRAAPVLAADQ